MRFLPYLVSIWFGFPSHIPSMLTLTHTVYAWLAVWFPFKLVFIKLGVLEGNIKQHEVWHQCDGLICYSWTGIMIKWVRDTRERGGSRETVWRVIWGSLSEIYVGWNSVLLFTDGGALEATADLKDLLILFIEHLPGQVRAFTTLLKRPQRLNSPALKNLAVA